MQLKAKCPVQSTHSFLNVHCLSSLLSHSDYRDSPSCPCTAFKTFYTFFLENVFKTNRASCTMQMRPKHRPVVEPRSGNPKSQDHGLGSSRPAGTVLETTRPA